MPPRRRSAAGYSKESARKLGSRVLNRPRVREALRRATFGQGKPPPIPPETPGDTAATPGDPAGPPDKKPLRKVRLPVVYTPGLDGEVEGQGEEFDDVEDEAPSIAPTYEYLLSQLTPAWIVGRVQPIRSRRRKLLQQPERTIRR